MDKVIILCLILLISKLGLTSDRQLRDYFKCPIETDTLTDTIKWSPDYKLSFNDFQAKEHNKELAKRATGHSTLEGNAFTGIGFDIKREGEKIIVVAFGCFSKSRSWIKRPEEKVLKHEQGHFDIAEVYARKFEQAMKQHQDATDISYFDKLYKTLEEINNELLQEQDKYDEAAITPVGQEMYYKKIENELKPQQ